MTSSQRGPWWRRPLAVLAALAVTGGAVVVTAPAASAAPAPVVSAGSLDWGVKASFRSYLGSPIAKGTTTLGGGAMSNADGTFKFQAAAVDPASQIVSFAGSVAFSGHAGQLAVTIADIRLDLGRGMLVADVASKSLDSEAMVTYDEVDLTTLGAGATFADGNASGSALPTELTAGGAPAFASFYAEGDPFDPVSFAVSYVVPVEAPVVTASPVAQTVETGNQVTFTADASGYDSVQWQVLAAGAGAWADIAGATNPSLTITATTADTGNQYRAAFMKEALAAYSEAAILTVTEPVVPEVPDVPEVPVFTPALEVFAADGVTVLSGPVVEGTKIVVRGSGFDPAANVVPEGARPPISAGSPAGVYVVFGKFADQWRPSEGAPSSARVVGDQAWAMSQAALDAVPAAYQGAIRGQWVEVSPEGDFTAELTVQKKVVKEAEVEWPEAGNFGVYTYPAAGTVNAEQELYAPVTVGEPVVFTPALEVFAADGVTVLSGPVVEGTKIVVRGSGFDPAANVVPEGARPPISAGSPAGVYVVFGKFADQWRPSEGAPSSARVVGDQAWAMSQAALDAVPAAYQGAIRGQWVEVSPEGDFTAELTVQKKVVKEAEVEWPEAGNFGVYTYPAAGTVNAEQELYAPVTVGEPVAKPVLTVDPATGLKHNSKVMVSGSGYAANRWIYVAEVAQGPGGETRPADYENAVRVQTDANGTFGPLEFSVTTIFKNGGFTAVDNTLYVSTFNSPLDIDNVEIDRANDRSQDAFVELAWADASAPVVTDPEPEVPAVKPELTLGAAKVETGKTVTLNGSGFAPASKLSFDLAGEAIEVGTATPATGSLDWGVKESFRTYLGSSIAKGTITTDGGATVNDDGSYRFPAVSFNATNKVASYSGSVSMVGHEGALQVTLSNLRLDVKGGKLLADVISKSLDEKAELKSYPGVALVAVDTKTVSSGADGISGKNLPTALTKAGAPAFASFYNEGDAFDALSFEVAAASVDAVVDEGGTFSLVWAVPATQKPGSYTVTATATAPAAAATAAAQALAADDSTAGVSAVQSASAQLTITAPAVVVETPEPTAPVSNAPVLDADAKCTNGTVMAGNLTWGIKESFRKYMTGNISHGSITFNEFPATWETLFTFTKGTGTIDAQKRTGEVTFDGVVTFQGHDYGSGSVLSVTMQNLTLVMDGNSGTLKADVQSRALESATVGSKPGADTTYKAVILANLDLSKGAFNDAQTLYSGTAVPVTLAASGVAPFADFYAAGENMDPLSFSLGCAEGEVPNNVDTGAGNTVVAASSALANTGAMGLDASVIGALMILMLGSGVIVSNRLVRRRRY
ncbi:HtaA domain-containing protein [Specibacter sp. NPDC078692]|uniref:HtaA domain-containing protein n=1 Tax=Specibacter sp. NPDC078692 TaxID=3155818 RepID=UPI00343EB03D